MAQCVIDEFRPIQAEYERILADREYLDGVLKDGAAAASRMADRMVAKVYKKIGLVQL